MVILSFEFALCFVLFFILYWACAWSIKLQNALLIGAGILFMLSWQWQFVVSLLLVWGVTQVGVLVCTAACSLWVRRLFLVLSLGIMIAHLAFFKYINFAIGEINGLLPASDNVTPLDIVLPLGISFYTFQAISYLIDVYNKKITAVPSALLLGVLSFVPTVMAGPIFRVSDAKSQWISGEIVERGKLGQEILAYMPTNRVPKSQQNKRSIVLPHLALALIAVALVKKIWLAGWLENLWVTPIFSNPLQYNGVEVLTGVYAYALQLYFDFSGYSDLAIALGLLLGVSLPKNFDTPYLATDIQNFWARWHITLSHWIRDYIYIPLGGGRRSFWRVQLNLMLAFVLSGVWHGAGYNFLLWGAIHGIALVWLNIMKHWGLRGWLTRQCKPLAIWITFHYVCFGWIFFRSDSLTMAVDILRALTHFVAPLSLSVLPTLLLMVAAWIVYPKTTHCKTALAKGLYRVPFWLLPMVSALFFVVLFALSPDGLPGFIYANF